MTNTMTSPHPKRTTYYVLSSFPVNHRFSLPYLRWLSFLMCGVMIGLENYRLFIYEWTQDTGQECRLISEVSGIWEVKG
jgi:hypothetical protein